MLVITNFPNGQENITWLNEGEREELFNYSLIYLTDKMIKCISKRWRLLSGQDKWKSLLDPLDIDLRRYIIHYGERAQATYDTFNNHKVSRYAGSSIYAGNHLFDRVGLNIGNPFKYKLVKYLYATSRIAVPDAFIMKSLSKDAELEESNWMGYVAVATDEGKIALGRRDILIAWRGTVKAIEWAKDFDFPLVSASEIVGKTHQAYVHKGVLSIYTSSNPLSTYNHASARDQVLKEVKKQVDVFKDEEISITIAGHSLGAALSTLNAADIVANGYNKSCPVTVFAFGSPLVGDSNFRDVFQAMKNLHLLRIRNAPDIVPLYPPLGYTEVGEELLVDSRYSSYLNPGDVLTWHNLEASYLHSVAGTQGSKGGFHLEVKRDIALVNKHSDALKDEYLIPTSWWCQKNNGMVQQQDGTWKLEDHDN